MTEGDGEWGDMYADDGPRDDEGATMKSATTQPDSQQDDGTCVHDANDPCPATQPVSPRVGKQTRRPDPYKFNLPIRYAKGEDDLGEKDGVAGSIRDSSSVRGYHLARIWNTGICNPDEFAELLVTAVNAFEANQAEIATLKSLLSNAGHPRIPKGEESQRRSCWCNTSLYCVDEPSCVATRSALRGQSTEKISG